MASAYSPKRRVFLDLTHVGRHVTGLERVSIEQFEKVDFENADVKPVRAKGVVSMVLRQQLLLPLLALLNPRARFVFPGFPPSPVFALIKNRVTLYVHDTFLLTRKNDLSVKARLYMAPQFAFAVRHLTTFLVNSEKTLGELKPYTREGASIRLYRPAVSNVFALEAGHRAGRDPHPRPLKLVALGTIEPRKNYAAATAILDCLRASGHAGAELHIIGRAGWGEDSARIAAHPGVMVHGYLSADAVRQRMDDADVYLCTSHDEGLGLPLLEAQYAGLPVVAPEAPVFREVLGTSGTFIRPSDAENSARIIAGMVTDPDWRAAHSKAALANVSRWNALAGGDLGMARRMFAGRSIAAQSAGAAAARAL